VVETLDIFIKMEEGAYEWKAAAEDFQLALPKIEQLVAIAPADYVIFDQATGHETVIKLESSA